LTAKHYQNRRSKYHSLIAYYNGLKLQLFNMQETDDIVAVSAIESDMLETKRIALKLRRLLEPLKIHAAAVAKINNRFTEHNAALAWDRQSAIDKAQMKAEITHFAGKIQERYSALGYNQVIHYKGKEIRRKVQFEEWHYTEDQHKIKLFVSYTTLFGAVRNIMPEGVWVRDLVSDDTLNELSSACERPVYSPHQLQNGGMDHSNGTWLIVDRVGFTGGLPETLFLSQLLAKYPHDKRLKFPVPFGLKKGRIVNWAYLSEYPHFMVNGISGSGKTNLFRVVLSTLISKNSPDEIRIVLVDLKQGGDFAYFEKCQHLLTEIVTDLDSLEIVTSQLIRLMTYRMSLFKKLSAFDIDRFNSRVDSSEQMPRVLVMMDEFMSIKHLPGDPNTRNKIVSNMSRLAMQARASGIHLMVGGQQAFSANSIGGALRDNISYTLTGRQRTAYASIASLGHGGARKILDIPGRMICDKAGQIFDIQTPLATEDDIKRAVEAGEQYPSPRAFPWGNVTEDEINSILTELDVSEFDEIDLVRVSLEHYDGIINTRAIFDSAICSLTRNELETLRDNLAKRGAIQYDGDTYKIERYKRGYHLVLDDTHIPIYPNENGVYSGYNDGYNHGYIGELTK
jgi:DNA segregation ATPase FtsK/SpoIIIE-like protein